jgi:putative ABC transport system permease protein
MLLSIIGGLTVAVLLIAASNVANLLLGRALAQRSEIATRLAIGAGIFRLVRQRLVESLVLAAAAGLCGLLISYWVANAFSAVALLPGFELRLDLAPDWRVLAVTLGCAMAASAVATLGPSLAATRSDPVVWLKEGGGSIGSVRASRFRSGLVVAQVAIASLVAVAACLLVKSGGAAARLDLGFRTEGTFATDIDLRAAGYSEARARAFYQVLLEKAAAVPGVRSVALANRAPLDSSTPILRITDEQSGPMAPDDETALDASSYFVSSRYFETVAVPLLAGRALDPRDSRLGSRGVVINETLVRRLWPGQPPGNALGRRIGVRGLGSPPAIEGNLEVIGVARDAKYRTLGEDRQPHVYLDVEQFFAPDLTLLVHAPGVPPPVMATQAVIAGIDPSIQGFFTRTLEEHTRVSLAPARFAAAASGVVGAVAGTLGAVGLYGVIFCLVSERRRELAMCLALGATPAGLTRAVLGQGLRLAAIGVAIGLAGAVLATPLLADLLYETSPTDPVIYGAVLLGGLIVALGASYGPARAASRVDPITAMRG